MSLKNKIFSFILVGGVSAILDVAVFYGLHKGIGIDEAFARAISYIAGSTLAYFLNSFFTFNGQRSAAEKFRAAISYAVCFTLAVMSTKLIMSWWSDVSHIDLIAWILSQGIATVVNFLLQNFWVFQHQQEDSPSQRADS